jgi:hypothetical protein
MGDRKGAYRLFVWKPEGRKALEDRSVEGRIILKCVFEKWEGGMVWIDWAQNRDRWLTVVHAVLNLRIP